MGWKRDDPSFARRNSGSLRKTQAALLTRMDSPGVSPKMPHGLAMAYDGRPTSRSAAAACALPAM